MAERERSEGDSARLAGAMRGSLLLDDDSLVSKPLYKMTCNLDVR